MSILQNPIKIFTELLEADTNVVITQKSIDDVLTSNIDLNIISDFIIKPEITDITSLNDNIINNQLKTSISGLSTNTNYNIFLLKETPVKDYQTKLFDSVVSYYNFNNLSVNPQFGATRYYPNQDNTIWLYGPDGDNLTCNGNPYTTTAVLARVAGNGCFNGGNTGVYFSNAQVPFTTDSTQDFTIGFWFIRSNNNLIFQNFHTTLKLGFGFHFENQKVVFSYYDDTQQQRITSQNTFSTGPGAPSVGSTSWHYVTIVYVDKQLIMYVDGTQQASIYAPIIKFQTRAEDCRMYSSSGGYGAAEGLDDLTIWSRALTLDEIKFLSQPNAPSLFECGLSNVYQLLPQYENSPFYFISPKYELSNTLTTTNDITAWLTPYISEQSATTGIYPIYTTTNYSLDITNQNISTNEFTISFWTTRNGVNWKDLFCFGISLNNSEFLTKLEYNSNGNLNLYPEPEIDSWIPDNLADGLYIPANKFVSNKFQLITITVKDSILKYYVNNELFITSKQNSNWPNDTVLTKLIFGGNGSTARTITSYFADFKIYSKAFTDTEVQSYYQNYLITPTKPYEYYQYTVTTPGTYNIDANKYSVLPNKQLTNTTDDYTLLSNGTVIVDNELITYKVPHPVHYKFNNIIHNGYLCKKANKMISPKLV